MDWTEIKNLKKEPKEKRLEYYFYHNSEWKVRREDLDLTDEDVRAYQKRKESEVSMKPTQKRDILVKQMLKPLLKASGFKNSGLSWWKELEYCWLFIYMKNSRWNGIATGATFEFIISVSGKDEIREKPANQWLYNHHTLKQSDFLPYCGYLASHMETTGYKIDGYRSYLPTDEPLEEIIAQVQGDFENYILPALARIHTKEDWERLYEERRAAGQTAENRLLRYYSLAHMLCCSESNIPELIQIQHNFALTAAEITSRFDWLETIRQNSALPHLDARPFILKTLEME